MFCFCSCFSLGISLSSLFWPCFPGVRPPPCQLCHSERRTARGPRPKLAWPDPEHSGAPGLGRSRINREGNEGEASGGSCGRSGLKLFSACINPLKQLFFSLLVLFQFRRGVLGVLGVRSTDKSTPLPVKKAALEVSNPEMSV